MAPGKDQASMPNLAPSHLEHLNRIPGLQTSERSWQMSVPGRELLGNKTIFGEDTLSCLQRANGTILIQCVDFFAEFLPGDYDEAPARLNNVEYDVEFWRLIKDLFPYDEARLTPNVVKRVYRLLMDCRLYYKLMHPHSDPSDMSMDERFFLKCLDKHQAHCTLGCSHTQLMYGSRRNDNFSVRLATRARQWRYIIRNQNNQIDLLSKWPDLGVDVLPVNEWDRKFMKEATSFSTRFRKPAPQTPVASLTPDLPPKLDGSHDLSEPQDSNGQMEELTGLVKDMKMTMIVIKKDMDSIKKDVGEIKKDVNSLKKQFFKDGKKIEGSDSVESEKDTPPSKRPRIMR